MALFLLQRPCQAAEAQMLHTLNPLSLFRHLLQQLQRRDLLLLPPLLRYRISGNENIHCVAKRSRMAHGIKDRLCQ